MATKRGRKAVDDFHRYLGASECDVCQRPDRKPARVRCPLDCEIANKEREARPIHTAQGGKFYGTIDEVNEEAVWNQARKRGGRSGGKYEGMKAHLPLPQVTEEMLADAIPSVAVAALVASAYLVYKDGQKRIREEREKSSALTFRLDNPYVTSISRMSYAGGSLTAGNNYLRADGDNSWRVQTQEHLIAQKKAGRKVAEEKGEKRSYTLESSGRMKKMRKKP